MNRLIVILIAAMLGFIVAFALTRSAQRGPALLDTLPELEWLRKELNLDQAQYAQAAALHQNYRPRCEELCSRVLEARLRVDAAAAEPLTEGEQLSPALAAALDEQARVYADCQKAMIAHLNETAAIMTPEQAERYLKATMPHALNPSSHDQLSAH